MIIRKIIEVTETDTTESFQLICHEKDEGWELTREEMEKLRVMTERSLEDFYGRREKETVPAELYDDLYRKYNLACFQLDEAKGKFYEDLTNEVDQAEECPDYIEPPAPKVVCENGVCQLVLPEEEETPEPAAEVTETSENLTKSQEKVQESEEKPQKSEPRDFSRYIQMFKDHVDGKEIQLEMIDDWGISESTANNYYYTKVKKAAETEIEDEKKSLERELEKKLEKKIQVIPASEPVNPRKRRSFTEEEKERIRRAAGVSIK